MVKQTKVWWSVLGVVLLVLLVTVLAWHSQKQATQAVKIGIISDFSGPVSYWGESTRLGAELAKQDLQKAGYQVQFIFEDDQLDAAKALTAAQKLVNVDGVQGVYSEFNAAAISANSFLKGEKVLHVYDAAAESPLKDNTNAYKTYLDYRAGCQAVAQKFKDNGVTKIGLLKINIEAGELCLQGVQEIFGQQMAVESYNIGELDFRTQMLKLKQAQVGAIINAAYEDDTLSVLKIMKEQSLNLPFGTVEDTVTQKAKDKYPEQLANTWSFGFSEIDPDFIKRVDALSTQKVSSYYGAALAYIHLTQMVKAIAGCSAQDMVCVSRAMDKMPADKIIGFNSYHNRIADLTMSLKQY